MAETLVILDDIAGDTKGSGLHMLEVNWR